MFPWPRDEHEAEGIQISGGVVAIFLSRLMQNRMVTIQVSYHIPSSEGNILVHLMFWHRTTTAFPSHSEGQRRRRGGWGCSPSWRASRSSVGRIDEAHCVWSRNEHRKGEIHRSSIVYSGATRLCDTSTFSGIGIPSLVKIQSEKGVPIAFDTLGSNTGPFLGNWRNLYRGEITVRGNFRGGDSIYY